MGIEEASLKKGGAQSQSTRPRGEGPLHQNEGYYVIIVYKGIDGIVGEIKIVQDIPQPVV